MSDEPLSAMSVKPVPARCQPVLIQDTREQDPLPFHRLPFVVAGLRTGDYSFQGGEELFAVERKSIADLVSCCVDSKRERFEHELHRLRGYRFKRLLIIGQRADITDHKYRSMIEPKSVLHTLDAFEVRYEVPVVFLPDPETAGRQVESWVFFAARECFRACGLLLKPSARQAPRADSSSPA